jgi:hypothetical protein
MENQTITNQFCIYDKAKATPATHLCSACGVPLCNSCGYLVGSEHFCNKCYANQDEQETGKCSSCGEDLAPIYENNGFTEPAGPSHWEITGYKLCPCRKGEN